jgi:hypothetical protein
MDRRNALKIAAGAVAAGGVGVVALTTAFKPETQDAAEPEKLATGNEVSNWTYVHLDPEETARIAYKIYPEGSCMYGIFSSVITQLADRIGEPYASFPIHMMKYGHGGIGGYGSTCGTINGAAALIGLFVEEKEIQNILITDLFRWYEETHFPVFKPDEPVLDYTPPTSVAGSTLCHVSNTKWGASAGLRIDSKERKERCRRMTADIAAHTVDILNSYFNNTYVSNTLDNETVRNCMTCHGKKGKLANTNGHMTCTSCHPESLGHRVFADAHYKLMKNR